MIQVADGSSLSRELERFFIVAQTHQHETGIRAYMPACPVDSEWHRRLEKPEEYRAFCHNAVGCDILHEPAQGQGMIDWTGTYEKLYGPLPEIWFRNTNGILDKTRRQKYLDTGVFYASWDCNPY